MTSADSAEPRETAGPSRTASRSTSRPSRHHHLEPNPFEQSFSSKPSDQGSTASPENSAPKKGNKKGAGQHKSTKSDTRVKSEGEEDGSEDLVKAADGSRRSNEPLTPSASQTPSKRILPPVSSIASPAAHETSSVHYPWSSSLTGSLRSGPLSPAMLAGPQSFDASSFRSGFTPDLSNFKTGLTPLGTSSNSFPPPSPNTAAFLAMVTNSSAPGLSGTTITPNTLSALSGNPMDAHANGASLVSSQPGNHSDKGAQHGEHHDQFDYAFGRSMQDTPTRGGSHHQPTSKLRMATSGEERSASPEHADGQAAKRGGEKPANRQQTTQAASGLFLLSQAHQELSKREDAAAAAAQHGGHEGSQQLYSGNAGAQANRGQDAKGSKATKRKKSAEPAAAAAGKVGKKAKARKVEEEETPMDEDGYESDDVDEDGNRRVKSSNGDGGDDEEKRKNFLERNRQAALKCRQRKKAWLASLQAKVEYLQSDNENLQGTVGALRNEVMYLKSQLMQAQRQLGGHGGGAMVGGQVEQGGPTGMSRNSVSGPGQMQNMAGGMEMSHNMPSQSQQHQQSNINAMAAAAAAAAGNNRMGSTAGQYQAHAVPRPTHIPGQPGNQQYAPNVHKNHARQSSAQAA